MLVNIKSGKPYDVYIGRPGKWGNPYNWTSDTPGEYRVNDRMHAISAYRDWLVNGEGKHLLDDLHELEGKVLGCWCHPLPCHGTVLINLLKKKL